MVKPMKVFVVYDSMFGNTKKVAEEIGKSINEIEGMEVLVNDVKEVKSNDVLDYDVILVGSPNHMGGPTRPIKKFIDGLGKIGLKEKKIAVFDTYVKKNVGKAVRKMEKKISKNVPKLILMSPGLSIKVVGIRGPIEEGELSRAIDFAKDLANK